MIQTTAPALLAAINGASSKLSPPKGMQILGCVTVSPTYVTATDLMPIRLG